MHFLFTSFTHYLSFDLIMNPSKHRKRERNLFDIQKSMFTVVYPPLDSFICSSSPPGERANDGMSLQNEAVADRF